MNRQTVSFHHNYSLTLDTQETPRWDRNLPNFTFDLISSLSAIKR